MTKKTKPPAKKTATPNKGGRPTKFTPELTKTICRLIATGYALRKICKMDGMPSQQTVFNWLLDGKNGEEGSEHRTFFEQYGRAREIQAQVMVDSMLEKCEDQSRYWLRNPDTGELLTDNAGVPIFDRNYAARLREELQTMRWMAGRLAPKEFGDQMNLNVKDETKAVDAEEAKKFIKSLGVKDFTIKD